LREASPAVLLPSVSKFITIFKSYQEMTSTQRRITIGQMLVTHDEQHSKTLERLLQSSPGWQQHYKHHQYLTQFVQKHLRPIVEEFDRTVYKPRLKAKQAQLIEDIQSASR
jgi:hypothetical protein